MSTLYSKGLSVVPRDKSPRNPTVWAGTFALGRSGHREDDSQDQHRRAKSENCFHRGRTSGLTSRGFCEAGAGTKTGFPISLSFDSQFASFRCLSGFRNLSFRSPSARARETITRLNVVILSHWPDPCQAFAPSPTAVLRGLFHVLRWTFKRKASRLSR